MSRHNPIIVLEQIDEFARQAANLGREGHRALLDNDWKYRLAAERAVELIGEASTRLPGDLQERHSEIPWREMIGMRNRLIHGYEEVDQEIVWDVPTVHAPHLISRLPAIIATERNTKEYDS